MAYRQHTFTSAYDLSNLDDIINQPNEGIEFIRFIKKNKNEILYKPEDGQILKLKNKIEMITNLIDLRFIDFFIYEELTRAISSLVCCTLSFVNCTLGEGAKPVLLELLNKPQVESNRYNIEISKIINKNLFSLLKEYYKDNRSNTNSNRSLDLRYISSINKLLFLGLYLTNLSLQDLKISDNSMKRVLKSLHGTKSLRTLYYSNHKAIGLIHENEEFTHDDVLWLNIRLVFKSVDKIFLNPIPSSVESVAISHNSFNLDKITFLITKLYHSRSKDKQNIQKVLLRDRPALLNYIDHIWER